MEYKAKYTRKDAGKPKLYHGKKVVDSRAPLYFVVTEDDCSKSTPNDPEHCAGAEAIRRSLPDVVGVHVHRNVVFLEYPKRVVRFKTSHPVRDQVVKFDYTGKFDPGSYRLKAVTITEIENRGKQSSKPDRSHGAEDSPLKRKAPIRNLGRAKFHFE